MTVVRTMKYKQSGQPQPHGPHKGKDDDLLKSALSFPLIIHKIIDNKIEGGSVRCIFRIEASHSLMSVRSLVCGFSQHKIMKSCKNPLIRRP